MTRTPIATFLAAGALLVFCPRGSLTQAQMSDTTAKTNASRLTQPWSKMTTLSSEQVNQIADIHRRTLTEIRALEGKEHTEITALLSDDQKIELNRIQNQPKTKTAETKDEGAMQ